MSKLRISNEVETDATGWATKKSESSDVQKKMGEGGMVAKFRNLVAQ